MLDISFLIPLFNDEQHIIDTVERTIIPSVKKLLLSYEVIICNDASTDKSLQVAKQLEKKYPNVHVYTNDTNLGFARTYKNCVQFATGRYAQYIPSDNAILSDELISMLRNINKYPVILQGCTNPRQRQFKRYIISMLYTKVLNRIHHRDLSYYNGLNIYPLSFLKQTSFSTYSFAFQAELLILAIKDYDFIEIPMRCKFTDETSTAFNLKNICSVLLFLFRQVFQSVK